MIVNYSYLNCLKKVIFITKEICLSSSQSHNWHVRFATTNPPIEG
ncbi:hypothetical protein HMPREF9347_01568 [Escherichia coli MS 124-1]|nr:hypothetical protein HMPREF9347_01568 [Escherichia coli MS 124-1]